VTEEGLPEAERLERLWAEGFGDRYVERNADAGAGRDVFWRGLVDRIEPRRVLEVGCNVGANLRWLVDLVPPRGTWGIDINDAALSEIRRRLPSASTVWAPARELPFRDRHFDLVFTAGVLIHQPEATLPLVMNEVVRCSHRYVLALEYYAEIEEEIPYRGHSGALFRRDYGRLYSSLFPDLQQLDSGFLPAETGWDDVTWWLFERP
jgi:pseudaminic acid biosynthesis-associated methylase